MSKDKGHLVNAAVLAKIHRAVALEIVYPVGASDAVIGRLTKVQKELRAAQVRLRSVISEWGEAHSKVFNSTFERQRECFRETFGLTVVDAQLLRAKKANELTPRVVAELKYFNSVAPMAGVVMGDHKMSRCSASMYSVDGAARPQWFSDEISSPSIESNVTPPNGVFELKVTPQLNPFVQMLGRSLRQPPNAKDGDAFLKHVGGVQTKAWREMVEAYRSRYPHMTRLWKPVIRPFPGSNGGLWSCGRPGQTRYVGLSPAMAYRIWARQQ